MLTDKAVVSTVGVAPVFLGAYMEGGSLLPVSVAVLDESAEIVVTLPLPPDWPGGSKVYLPIITQYEALRLFQAKPGLFTICPS
jgi:hypothetical protein